VKKPILREEPAKWRGKAATRAKPGRARQKPVQSSTMQDLGSSTITAKGQTTIPKKAREQLGLRSGSRLDFFLEPDGRVVLRGASLTIDDVFGILGKPKRRVSIEEMNSVIRRKWAGLR
jgi:AbrB family looped-hinge helix DNA binding protein